MEGRLVVRGLHGREVIVRGGDRATWRGGYKE